MKVMNRAREVQAFAGNQLYAEVAPAFTDVEEWKLVQSQLGGALKELEKLEGTTPEEEGELLLALLMGYCVTVRNGSQIDRVLERAERVMPRLTDKVLKCKLAAFCYQEVPDEELQELTCSLLRELERDGRGDEVRHLGVMVDL